MNLKNILKELTAADSMGGLFGALEVAEKYLKEYSEVERYNGSLIATLGSGEKTVLLDAHIDEIGMFVTSVDNGFLSVAAAGGIDARMLPAMRVKIHGKETVTGVFTSVPPHLSKDSDEAPKLDSLYIDTGLGEDAKNIISVGDRVAFLSEFLELNENVVSSKALDNRASVAALIKVAEMLQEKDLGVKVAILLSDKEEIGGDGAKTAAFHINPDEAVVVDVSFGNAPGIAEEKSGVLGKGAMIGISPVLSREVTESLKNIALSKEIPHQFELMGSKTSTNADVVSTNREGVKCSLVSIPLRNMHTPSEIVDVRDIEAVANLLAEYIICR